MIAKGYLDQDKVIYSLCKFVKDIDDIPVDTILFVSSILNLTWNVRCFYVQEKRFQSNKNYF